MSKFNIVEKPTTLTYEGGEGIKLSCAQDFLLAASTCFIEDSFYEGANVQIERLLSKAAKLPAEFVAKTAIYLRTTMGMRSVSHILAAYLAFKTFPNKKGFYNSIVHRPDDMLEIMALMTKSGQKWSNPMLRGFASKIETLSPYALTKYKGTGKEVNMYDLINICHPKSNDTLHDFMHGKLTSADTWEVAISTAKTLEEKQIQWDRLVQEHKLGYLALIRNLRNILEVNNTNWIKNLLIEQITDPVSIEKSLVFPYQIYNAWRQVSDNQIQEALQKACELSLNNVPLLSGSTEVLVDLSGSMDTYMSERSNITYADIACLFALTIAAKQDNAEIECFATYACKFYPNKFDLEDIYYMKQLRQYTGYGTDLPNAIRSLSTSKDRLIIITDEQTMGATEAALIRYSEQYGRPEVYAISLGGYDNHVLPHANHISGLNNKLFDYINMVESINKDRVGFVNTIEQIQF